jgi:hypothetical protein
MSTRTLLAGVAALFLATGTAHAADQKWEGDFRRCWAKTTFEHSPKIDDPLTFGYYYGVEVDESKTTATVILSLEDVLELQKRLPLLKKCTAFFQCLKDREAGKVKHSYENDKRWR